MLDFLREWKTERDKAKIRDYTEAEEAKRETINTYKKGDKK